MTCPFYSKTENEYNCYQYGKQDESKAIEDCMGDFASCFQNAREKASSQKVNSFEETSSPIEAVSPRREYPRMTIREHLSF